MSSSPVRDALKSRRKVAVQGLHPASQMIQKESLKVQKPLKKPVVVYMASPRVFHAEPCDFMALVQRLTGPSSSPDNSQSDVNDQYFATTTGGSCQFPLKVKARPMNGKLSKQSSTESRTSPTLFLHESSVVPDLGGGGGVDKGSGHLASQSWSLEGEQMSQSDEALGSRAYFDVFGDIQGEQ